MTREAEIRASEQMRDRIAEILAKEAAKREDGGGNSRKGALLRAMERIVRGQHPAPAQEVIDG